MSKLAELVQKATRLEPPPIGFGVTQRKPAPSMVLVALAHQRWAEHVRHAYEAGADAFLLTGRPNDRELSEAVSAAGDRPCGLVVPGLHVDQLSQLRDAGLDFLVVELDAPVAPLLDQDLAVVLHIKDELTDVQLRMLEQLPIEAILAEREAGHLTIRRLLELERISTLTQTPLLLRVRPDAEQQDLLSLRDAGVALAAIDLSERGAPEAVRRLRDLIDGLPPRPRLQRRRRPFVALPPTPGAGEAAEEEEEPE